jgi:Tfp pilus assembly protein PilN
VRPVNLIPPEERGDKAPIRTGPIAYLLVGALALALGAITMLVLTDNKVSDRKAEIAGLKLEAAAERARAEQLAPFASFNSVEQQRNATIKSLANSRFDWERIMRELALIIPSDVWLTELTGSVAGGAAAGSAGSAADATGTADGGSITGPSIALTGCAVGQDGVARFLSALRDIDGVTRVGLTSSERPTSDAVGASADSAGGAADADCRTRDFITKFEIVAAFDAVPTPQISGAAPSTPAATEPAPAPEASTPPESDTETTPASDTGT